ncbi:CobW family GTP-binding protein [Streptomyces sp. NPDC005438]|uniref:CobW family GTP-binding protein n=1 Tax=Streptomyces sp. NPDC005438 TaxID=3156880 RepID=UPI0033ACBBAB
MTTRPIPVVLLAGFLGSGKTTVLNHLLRHSGGTRIGAVVNDFGSIEIDAMSVAGQVDSMVSLGNGCLCCAVDVSDLDEVLEKLAHPSAGMDLLVIEASGLAEPETLIRMILASENPHIVYGGMVLVVDAAEYRHTRRRHPEIERHLPLADLVVLNKVDRIEEEQRLDLARELRVLSGSALVSARYGRVDPELLFDVRPEETGRAVQLSFDQLWREDPCEVGGEHGEHLHEAYQSLSYECSRPLHPGRLMAFLDDRPEGLYRLKGEVCLGVAGGQERYSVHAVGEFLRFYPSTSRGGEPGTQLVLIGTDFAPERTRERLEGCRLDEGERPGPESMWGVLRFVDGPSDDADLTEDPPPEESVLSSGG